MSRALIDTQSLIWFAENATELSARAVAIVDDPSTVRIASVASLWEMAIKMPLGKLTLRTGTLQQFASLLVANQIALLPVTGEDALAVADLPTFGWHRIRSIG